MTNNMEILTGEVVYVRSDEYLVDIGTGADVSLPFSEATAEHETGEMVDIVVIDKVKGEKIVSEKRVGNLKKKIDMDNNIGTDVLVHGTITYFHNGQFQVDLGDGLEGLCYIKNLESFFIKDGNEFVGKEYDFHITGVKYGKFTKYELSRKVVIDQEIAEKREKFDNLFQIGAILESEVKTHLKSGILLDHNGFEVFVPKSEISYVINDDLPVIGSNVKYQVIRTDADRFNAVGSIKEILSDPWEGIKDYSVGEKYVAKICRIESYGIFVELAENLHGLIHISELSHDFIDSTSIFNLGDEQEFKILEINEDNKKIKLSTKALYPSKYVIAKEHFKVGEHLVLPISKFYRSGIFVTLMNKYDVFVKNEEINNYTQTRPMLKIGDKLDFVLTSFNDEKEEIILSNQAYVEKETEIFESALDN